jgi:hypothetical protein
MVASHNKDKIVGFTKKWKYLLAMVVVALGIYVFREGKVDFESTANYLSFYSQWRPSILFYTLAVFSVLFYVFNKSRFQFKIIERLSELSFLIFFIHVIILEEIWKYFGYNLFNLIGGNVVGKIAFDPIFFLLVSGASFGVAYIIHKVPNLTKITG